MGYREFHISSLRDPFNGWRFLYLISRDVRWETVLGVNLSSRLCPSLISTAGVRRWAIRWHLNISQSHYNLLKDDQASGVGNWD